MSDRLKAWLKLLTTPEIGSGTAIKLVQILGKPGDFLYEHPEKLAGSDLVSSPVKDLLLDGKDPENWSVVSDHVDTLDIRFLSILDEEYPVALNAIYDPPPLLFYRGDVSILAQGRSIAVVGTRKPSPYGRIMTHEISRNLAARGFTIVSGLAYGIDSIAHKAALEAGGKTIAVMGTGVEQIYPVQNISLAERIMNSGILVSELIPGSRIEKWNFPRRNRIISGLSLGCLVMEGNRKSGALLTAKFALDQNRDVFALPGDTTREQSEGPNYLIQKGAKLVTKAEDIQEEYDLVMSREQDTQPELSSSEKNIYDLVRSNRQGIELDKILVRTGLRVDELSDLLLSLEIKNVIRRMPGNRIIPLF